MGDPRELEWAKKPDALKESWTARNGTHVYTEFPLQFSFRFPVVFWGFWVSRNLETRNLKESLKKLVYTNILGFPLFIEYTDM